MTGPASYGLSAMTQFDRLPFIKIRERAGHQSSFDRSGGNNDFGNVLYTLPNGERVLLDLKGPGCVYRLWFTGHTPSASLRVYFDDEATARIDLTFADLFSGTRAPFLAPLVANAQVASSGVYSYLPLPFRRAIRITTTDASTGIYYNVDYHLFEPDSTVATWTGSEDSTAARSLWSNVGDDPKPQSGATTVSGTATLAPGAAQDLLDIAGPRQISAIKLNVPGLVAGQAQPLTATDSGRAHRGYSEFRVAVDPSNQGVVLKRRFDYGIADQRASVYVDGAYVGDWFTPGSDSVDHWRDASFTLPPSETGGKSAVTVRIAFVSSAVDWNEFTYWVTSTLSAGTKQTDQLDVGNGADEAAHSYVINTQTWTGTRTFTYPPDLSPTDDGRAHQGSSQFTMAIQPGNQGVVLRRRLDYGVADQKAAVYVDAVLVGDWFTPGSDATNRWRNYGFAIPSAFTAGKSAITVKLVAHTPGMDWTEYRYWAFSKVDATRVLTDELDVSNAASEAAHGYTITGQTGTFTRSYSYPPQTRYRDLLNNASLQITWDGEATPSVNAPLGALFGMGQFGPADARALGAGILDDGTMYLYFPMPFANHATVRLVNFSSAPIPFSYQISHKAFIDPFQDVGYFKTVFSSQLPTTLGQDIVLLDAAGSGHAVGVVQSDQGATSRWFLEGDERAMVDDSRSPAVHGTGTEDFYNGAWYFENGPYTQPVSGNSAHTVENGLDDTAMYRQLISDAIPFRRHLRFTIEHGGTNDTSTNVWTLVYYYQQPTQKLVLSDTLNVGVNTSENQHSYTISQPTFKGSRTFSFEGENSALNVTSNGRAHKGTSQFTMAVAANNRGVVLRRMFDQGVLNQQATVSVDGTLVGTWYMAGGNGTHRWREEDFAIPPSFTSGKSAIRITIQFVSSTIDWNEFRYQTWSLLP